jgi:hypothetical protein
MMLVCLVTSVLFLLTEQGTPVKPDHKINNADCQIQRITQEMWKVLCKEDMSVGDTGNQNYGSTFFL